jgi:hypothetical protein
MPTIMSFLRSLGDFSLINFSINKTNPAELDKSLFAGIIYAKRIDNSATVTKRVVCRRSLKENPFVHHCIDGSFFLK